MTWILYITKKERKALKGSIKKWRGIVAGTGACDGTSDCPLCQLYYDNNCKGCPIEAWTGYIICRNTPIDNWETGYPSYDENYRDGKRNKKIKAAAQKELAFLIKLERDAEDL